MNLKVPSALTRLHVSLCAFRMKGGFSSFRGKEFSLLLIVILGTTILIWAWDRAPFLTTLLPPEEQFQLPQGVLLVYSSFTFDIVVLNFFLLISYPSTLLVNI